MHVLLTGATGFIGGHLRAALHAEGHAVRLAARCAPPGLRATEAWVPLDLAQPQRADDCARALRGVDALVNCVGILRERGVQTFQRLHVDGPRALFAAAAAAGVGRVVQVSALGADDAAQSAYHRSKKAADDALLTLLPGRGVVAQPSLVYGPGGASARLFTLLAALPVLALPAGGRQPVQPIHVDDLVRCLLALLKDAESAGRRVALVGPEPLTFGSYLQTLRHGMDLPAARTFAVPARVIEVAAGLLGRLPASPLDRDTWQMLQRGNAAPATDTERLLGHPPRGAEDFIPPRDAGVVRRAAELDAMLPVLRVSVALVWIVTAIVSFGVYPVEASYALLARAGVGGALAPWVLHGAALLDLAFGVATLLLPRAQRRWLWLAQIALIAGYTAVITVRLPEYWLHPYGPVLKNLPLLALLCLLYLTDREARKA